MEDLAELIKVVADGAVSLGLALLFWTYVCKLINLILRGYCALVDWIRDHCN